MLPRIGLGTDLHRLRPGNGLRLGGVDIPCRLSAVAHSDGDVLLHALADALLGALAQPDLGSLFPDTAPENRGRDSREFVAEAMGRLRAAGYSVVNADAVLSLEQPRLASHFSAIRASVAGLLAIGPDAVGIKAKTAEGLGDTGRGEAISAIAVALIAPQAP